MAELVVNGELMLYGPVGYVDFWDNQGFTSADVVTALASMEGDITVRLNSGGGIAMEGSAIYNALKRYPGKVTVKIDAIAASAASVIAMAGDEIEMPLGSMMMIHEPSGVTMGPADEHRRTAGVLDTMTGVYAELYADRTGIPEAEIRNMMKAETWLSPEDAKAKGFATATTDSGAHITADQSIDYLTYNHAPDYLKALAADRRAQALPMVAMAITATLNPPKGNEMTDTVENAQAVEEIVAVEVTASAKPKRDQSKQIMEVCAAARMSAADTLKVINDSGGDLIKAQAIVIGKLADDPVLGGPASITGHVVADGRDRMKMGMEKALLAKAGLEGGERNEFSSLTLREAGREFLLSSGFDRTKLRDSMQIAGMALGMRGFTMAGQHSTSDFAEVLANVAYKSMLRGFEESGETFQQWTRTGSLSDFKTAKRIDTGMFPALAEVIEGAEYSHATMTDRGVSVSLATYGKMFSITRQAIINDDLNAFTNIPRKMGRAASRTVGNLVYAKLTAPPVWSDSVAFWDAASHGNLGSGALTSAALDLGRAAMARQTDPDDHATGGLNITPAFLIVPTSIRGKALAAMESEFEVSGSDKRSPNYARNMATVVSDARLDTASTAVWYLAADPNMYDTIEVSYLDGNSNPVLEQQDGWNVDGVEFKVRLDAGVTTLDYRGLYKSTGS